MAGLFMAVLMMTDNMYVGAHFAYTALVGWGNLKVFLNQDDLYCDYNVRIKLIFDLL